MKKCYDAPDDAIFGVMVVLTVCWRPASAPAASSATFVGDGLSSAAVLALETLSSNPDVLRPHSLGSDNRAAVKDRKYGNLCVFQTYEDSKSICNIRGGPPSKQLRNPPHGYLRQEPN